MVEVSARYSQYNLYHLSYHNGQTLSKVNFPLGRPGVDPRMAAKKKKIEPSANVCLLRAWCMPLTWTLGVQGGFFVTCDPILPRFPLKYEHYYTKV